MYSPVCPIGAPSRDLNRPRRGPHQGISQRRPTPLSSRLNRPQGIVFSIADLPQEITNLQPSKRNGIVFNISILPQEVKELQVVTVPNTNLALRELPLLKKFRTFFVLHLFYLDIPDK
ncbi:hypothetical protein KEM48_008628 [Puccinia striiformis f. sp. tritici PST-130]|nr:hypothetical protein KEM48_008628 [Puccinia striiformis f. sp. tritici PST-130]